ncbi:hypothetical protein Salat_1879100 [Sesamum alatum]|uniref:Uncharacterized protein n=1 Tax=Sesamum alatum TaxID=300844 RepID=A0AAE1Y3B6_9LAMI|nr:hypothetical protein Salat_1879100 [Sesamum alatum]
MIDVGLVSHEFKAEAILEEELLIVVAIHPAPDHYEGPLDAYSRLLSFYSLIRYFFPFLVDRVIPCFAGIMMNRAAGIPIIEPSTSLEESTPFQTPLEVYPSSPIPPPFELVSSSQKRPQIEEVPIEESLAGEAPEPLVFPAQVLTPRLKPRAGVFNMFRTINCSNVELISSRFIPGIGNFIMTQASAIPAAMVEKHGAMLRNHETLRLKLQEARSKLSHFQQCIDEEGARTR